MSQPLRDFSNPYASPAADEFSGATETPLALLPRTSEIWFATIIIWCTALALASAAGYILLAWFGYNNPQYGVRLYRAAELAQFATGAANAIVMAGLVSYGQYQAVIGRDPIWCRSIALLLMIASLVIAVGSVLMFVGTSTMWLVLMPAALGSLLSLLMFRWYTALCLFRRQQRRKQKPGRLI